MTTPTKWSQRHLTIEYKFNRIYIRKLVSKFVGRYGGDWEEYLAEAEYLFVKHCHTWNPRKGTLQKHIGFRIWVGLLDLRRRNAIIWSRQQPLETHEPFQTISPLIDLMDEFGKDAKVIIQSILEPCLDLQFLIAERTGLRVVQRAIRELFAGVWSTERISNALEDIEAVFAAITLQKEFCDWLENVTHFE